MSALGADGYPRGWVVVSLTAGSFDWATAVPRLEEVLDLDVRSIGVDMPIGLPPPYPRAADAAARQRVGPRWTSVFLTPPRDVLAAPSHAQAVGICRALGIPAPSQQAYRLAAKIFEVEELANRDERIVEVHPEVSFAQLAGGPLPHSKHTWNGLMLRRRLLAQAGIEIPDEIRARVPSIDVLDAAVAAWSAARYASGCFETIPPDPLPGEPRIVI